MNEASQNHPARDPRFEKKFDLHGVTWQLVDAYTIKDDKPVRTGISQVRSEADIAPAYQVAKYAVQMKAGTVFPAITLWNDNIVDGNTRIAAAVKAGISALPAYLIDARNADHARDIGASLNQISGRPLTRTEAVRRAASMIDRGITDAFIAAELGYEASMVRRWRLEKKAEEHAEQVGVSTELEQLSKASQGKVATISHDKPFAEAVRTLAERDVPATEVRTIVEAARTASSDDAAAEAIREQGARFPLRGAGLPKGRGHRVPARDAYRSIGALTNHAADHWVDLTESGTAVPRWQRLRDLCDEVLAQYEHHTRGAA